MHGTDRALGLRERRKIRTKEAIRREAYRLIDENGYAQSVLLADAFDEPMLDALVAQPDDLEFD